MIKLVEYTKKYLDLSWDWLNDPEIKKMTNTPDFNKKEQLVFFNNLKNKNNYYIYGIEIEGVAVGACGLKSIHEIQ